MNLYVDMGANWANTLRLGPELFPNRDAWLTVAFEASPLIQPFVDEYVRFLNGERPEAPTVCLPRSGSTPHLRRYAQALGCLRKSDEAMRACMWTALAPHLSALHANPALNSSALINARMNEASNIASLECANGCVDRFVAVPAAVGIRSEWISMWGSPQQLIRGGAKPSALVPAETEHLHTVLSVDVVSWLRRAARRAKFVFLKMDVEGSEHNILRRMEARGVHRFIDAIALECHDFVGQCAATWKRIRRWNVTVINETSYDGMDTQTAAETSFPPGCVPQRRRVGTRRRGKWSHSDLCGAAILLPRTFPTCAVVGSAPSLAHLYQGAQIDEHSAVFRTNSHAVVDTVGSKTTFRIAANAFQLGPTRRRAGSAVQIVPPNTRSLPPGNLVTLEDQVQCVPNATMDKLYEHVGVRFGAHGSRKTARGG